jgi:type IV pilus assembly protein PilC
MAAQNTFVWTGLDKNGRKNQGEIVAASQALAKAQLRKQGISAKTVKRKASPLFSLGGKKIKSSDIAIFTRQMATMMKAGVPLVQSFDIVAEGLENEAMRTLVTSIKDDVASGGGFAPSLAKHPKYFDDLFCSLVGSGEDSGTLEIMLDRVATYKEKPKHCAPKLKKP